MTSPIVELARAHAPLLIVIAPLAGAALTAASPHARLSWALAALAGLAMTALALDLALRMLLGGAQMPIASEGLSLQLDGVGAFGAALIACAGALTAFGAGALLRKTFHPQAAPFALALILAMSAGWAGALLAGDFVALFLAVETAWLAGVGLVALAGERDRAALSGALRMLGAGGVAAALMLLGIGLIARASGAIDFAALGGGRIAAPGLAATGAGLVLLGLALKAGAAPLHAWTAAYGRAGGLGALALGAIGAVGALAVLIRVAALAMAAPAIADGVSAALGAIGVVSAVVGSFQAIGARNILRLAAYVGTAQAGCVLIAVAVGSPAGVAAALLQLFAFCAAAFALIGGAAAIGAVDALSALDGIGRRAPLASAAIAAGALSLMGAPLTIGFLGRWRLIEAGVGAGWWWATGVAIATSLAAVFYGGRLIERLYFRKSTSPYQGGGEPWRAALAPALVAAILAIALGIHPSALLQAADAAAALQLASAP